MKPKAVVLAGLLSILGAGAARAQSSFADEAAFVEGGGPGTFRSPQRFAFELRFGPYRPNVDSEFSGGRHPYQDFFGSGSDLLSQIELDYEFFHAFGSLGVGLGAGYFSVSGQSPVAGTGTVSGDQSTFKVAPFSLSAVYRFDYLLQARRFPLVPFAKLGLDYAYWQITDGSGEIATDSQGGKGRGGTAGWHAAGGMALVLDWFDPESARDFDADLGVNHTALVFQYTYSDISGLGQSGRLHVGDATWSLGLMLEF
jgi:hypothetical protein